MIKPADRTRYFQESVIRDMTRIAIREKAINLSQGLPDMPPPEEMVEAAKASLGSGYDQYSITYGDGALRKGIADDLRKQYGLEYDPEEEITVTCGVSEGIIAAVMAVLNPGDEVIFFEPYYENYLPAIVMAGGIPVGVELSPPRWNIRFDLFTSAISSKTKAIIINTPMNPTGKVFNDEELSTLGEICLEHNLVVISDEIYRHIVFEGIHKSPAMVKGFAARTIIVGGFSKTYSCTGWRVGYTAAKKNLAGAVRKIHDYLTICAPHPFQQACRAALTLPDDYYHMIHEYYLRRRDLLCFGLMDLGFKLELPQGAYYVLADFSGLSKMNDVEFTQWLAVDKGVAVVPGSSFYTAREKGKKLVRFCFALKERTLLEALDRIDSKLSRL